MPYTSGTFTRVSNSFSNPVFGTVISPTDAIALFDDYDDGLSLVGGQVFYAALYGVLGDGGNHTAAFQTLLNTVKAASGGTIVLPRGQIIVDTALAYSTTGSGILPGIQVVGQGAESTQIVFTGNSSFLFAVDSTPGFQSFVKFSGFKISSNGTNGGGISLHVCAYVLIEDMHILTTGTGIYDTAAGDTTSTFQAICRRVRFDNCGITAGTFGVDILPSGTAVEISNWKFDNCQWEANGVPAAAVTPPTSGAMRWRGLFLNIIDCGFTTNQNTSLYIAKTGGTQGVKIVNTDFENTISTVLPHVYCDAGIRLFKAENIQFLNADTWKCQGGIWFDSTSSTQGNITIDGVTIRVSTGNNPYVAFRQLGTATNWFADQNRVRNVNWQTFDGTGQTRFQNWQFDAIPGQCLLTISALGTVKLAPTGSGATMPLRFISPSGEWIPIQIASAGITAAGLVGLSANTQYYIYLGNSGSLIQIITPTLNLSSAAPTLDTSGYLVSSVNANFTFVGSFTTNGSGDIALTSAGYSFYPVRGRTRQSFGSGSGTYTTPVGVRTIYVRMLGGGGGGAGSGTTPGSGGNGGNSTFGTTFLTCNGGAGAVAATAGAGSTPTGGDFTTVGGAGQNGGGVVNSGGGQGGVSALGSNGWGGPPGASAGTAAGASTGSGGGGAGCGATTNSGGGGGASGYLEKIISVPAATYTYAVGAAGTAGTAGTSGAAGAAGGSGIIIVDEY